ncbi:MAG TPA: PepSY domain-containing protein [Steroidobacteraceae bacterium]|nr:PepSY domain-containing protein [Steroidobacteraceae bacterium]HNS27929.1 PepSY domain-containing protein [Steroidobacteraceae bacterium]
MRHFLLSLVFALGAALVSTGALADPDRHQGKQRGDRARQQQPAAPGMSLDAAVRQAERKYQARVIRAETRSSQDGRVVHVLRLLSEDGRVWTVKIDAASGAES